MILKSSILITDFETIDPAKDTRWVPDGENQWFLPRYLDLKNHTYSGYWLTLEFCPEPNHFHTGISQGVMLLGKMLLIFDEQKIMLEENQTFFVPSHQLHSAELIPSSKGYLNFGTIVGTTHYANETSDVKTYHELVRSHYNHNGISLEGLVYDI